MVQRDLEKQLLEAAGEVPVLAIVGPRQSGKTTLARHLFPEHTYVNLEDLEIRERAQSNPKGFLSDFPSEAGIILDEIQHVPDLFSYIQVFADEMKRDGFFIITGSQNFALHEGISQSLAGRVAEFKLFPFSINELVRADLLPSSPEEFVFKGCYPKLYGKKVSRKRVLTNYINTYVTRDVRKILNIKSTILFRKFLKSCAYRSGQILNMSSLADDLGIAHTTVSGWIALLQATYIIFLLEPYNKKISKQVSKSPKLFFHDTGLACSLIGINRAQDLKYHHLKGSLFETAMIADLYKQYCNLELGTDTMHFWKTYGDEEIDAVLDAYPHPIAIEIKSGETVSPDYFATIHAWQRMTKAPASKQFVFYGGDDIQSWPSAKVMSWHSIGTFVKDVLLKDKEQP